MSDCVSYCGVLLHRSVWNEIQRDAYNPNDYPKTYFCKICGHRHRYSSKAGFLHNPDIPLAVKWERTKEGVRGSTPTMRNEE